MKLRADRFSGSFPKILYSLTYRIHPSVTLQILFLWRLIKKTNQNLFYHGAVLRRQLSKIMYFLSYLSFSNNINPFKGQCQDLQAQQNIKTLKYHHSGVRDHASIPIYTRRESVCVYL